MKSRMRSVLLIGMLAAALLIPAGCRQAEDAASDVSSTVASLRQEVTSALQSAAGEVGSAVGEVRSTLQSAADEVRSAVGEALADGPVAYELRQADHTEPDAEPVERLTLFTDAAAFREQGYFAAVTQVDDAYFERYALIEAAVAEPGRHGNDPLSKINFVTREGDDLIVDETCVLGYDGQPAWQLTDAYCQEIFLLQIPRASAEGVRRVLLEHHDESSATGDDWQAMKAVWGDRMYDNPLA